MVIYDHIWFFRSILQVIGGRGKVDFRAPGRDEMAEVHQLNGLFLRLLHQAAQAGRPVLGFPSALVGPLAALDGPTLQRIACVPRCLFAYSLDGGRTPAPVLPPNPWESARRAFAQAALHGAWIAARYSSAVARALYGLSAEPVRGLRTFGVDDLVSQAAHPGVITCGFDTVPGIWDGLIGSPSQPPDRGLVLAMIAAGRGAAVTPKRLVAAGLLR